MIFPGDWQMQLAVSGFHWRLYKSVMSLAFNTTYWKFHGKPGKEDQHALGLGSGEVKLNMYATTNLTVHNRKIACKPGANQIPSKEMMRDKLRSGYGTNCSATMIEVRQPRHSRKKLYGRAEKTLKKYVLPLSKPSTTSLKKADFLSEKILKKKSVTFTKPTFYFSRKRALPNFVLEP
ncbi:hypothetical protein AAMO2058_001566700 [Amorphochlora amoebiformis]